LISKTLAEESAWQFAKEDGIDMVSINPGVVIGPSLQPTLASSVETCVYGLINGTRFCFIFSCLFFFDFPRGQDECLDL